MICRCLCLCLCLCLCICVCVCVCICICMCICICICIQYMYVYVHVYVYVCVCVLQSIRCQKHEQTQIYKTINKTQNIKIENSKNHVKTNIKTCVEKHMKNKQLPENTHNLFKKACTTHNSKQQDKHSKHKF